MDPWPGTFVEIATGGGPLVLAACAAMAVAKLKVAVREPGTAVLIFEEQEERWMRGVIDEVLELSAPEDSGLKGVSEVRFSVKVGVNSVIAPASRVHVPSSGGISALLREAAGADKEDLVKALLDLGVGTFEVDPSGTTALHTAAGNGCVDVCRVLLAAGIDPFLDNARQESPMEKAVHEQQNYVRRLFEPKETDADMEGCLQALPPLQTTLSGEGTQVPTFEADEPTGLSLLRLAAFSFNNAEATQGIKELLAALEASQDIEACTAACAHKGACGITPLMIASHRGFVNATKTLLANKADPNAQSDSGCSALLLAAEVGNDPIISELVPAGADLDLPTHTERATPLHAAARYGHNGTVSVLLELGADAELRLADGCTTLFLAAASGYEVIVKQLCDHVQSRGEERGDAGVSLTKMVNAQNALGETALIVSAMYGHEDSVGLLLDAGADVKIADEGGVTALLTACTNGNEKIARRLMEGEGNSAMIEQRGSRGETNLMSACRYGHLWMVRTLLTMGAKPNVVDNKGESALMHVCQYEQDDDDETLWLLLKAGASVDLVRPGDSYSALHMACECCHEEGVAQVIKAGADVNARTTGPNGYTPLTIAASNGYESIVSLLLDTPNIEIDKPRKTPKNPETDGMTALHCAALAGNYVLVNRLLAAGASHEVKNGKKQTPLMLAMSGDKPEHARAVQRLKDAAVGTGQRRRRFLSRGNRGSDRNSKARPSDSTPTRMSDHRGSVDEQSILSPPPHGDEPRRLVPMATIKSGEVPPAHDEHSDAEDADEAAEEAADVADDDEGFKARVGAAP